MSTDPTITGFADPEGEAPWAMQLVVHSPKVDPPTTTAVCEAAALATLAVLSDDRAAEGGPWHPLIERWTAGRIRKLVRRARGARWDAMRSFEQENAITVTHRGAQVCAFVPGPVDEVAPELAKLQVSGLTLEDPDAASPSPVPMPVPHTGVTLAVNPDLTLAEHPGKAAAQVAHGAQVAFLQMEPAVRAAWHDAGFPLRVVWPDTASWTALSASASAVITDAGFTVVAAGSQTVAVLW